MDRRKFLKKSIDSAKVISLVGLTGCAALDRYFEIEKSDYSKEVLIFGGGLSGLATAYFLKKNQIPYRIFEGSDRVGGRILSQRYPLPTGAIDMGARYIDSLDQDIAELIKEMNLELEEAPLNRNAYFFCLNKEVVSYRTILSNYTSTIKSWNKELVRIRKVSDQLSHETSDESWLGDLGAYEKIAFSDILTDSKLDSKGRFIFKSWAESHFQKKITEITFLEWLYHLESITLSGKKLYLPDGMSQFIDILGQRVSGVIPNYSMQVNSKLVEISRSKDKWICHIKTKDAVKKLSSPFVVLALPFNQLKSIRGIENVFTNKDFNQALMAAQFKSSYRVVFKTTSKSTKENGTYFFLELNKMQVQKEDLFYTVDFEQPIDSSNLNMIKNQMTQVFGVKEFDEISFYSWSQNPQINGRDLKLNVDTLLPIKSAYREDWQKISLQLAGDYLYSPDNANLNDCVKSAIRASKNLTALALEKELV